MHMNDLISGSVDLSTMRGMVACGGFSYGDVLGAGGGWGGRVLHRADLRKQFEVFLGGVTPSLWAFAMGAKCWRF